jgi:outer membrane protein assembly factor BamB
MKTTAPFYRRGSEHAVDLGFVPTPILPAPVVPAAGDGSAPAALPKADNVPAFPGTGRTLGHPGEMRWERIASAPLPEGPDFGEILQTKDRIVVAGPSAWSLFDPALGRITRKAWKRGIIEIDPERNLAYAPNSTGTITAYDLGTGAETFQIDFNYDVGYRKALIHRFGDRFLLIGTEESPPAHSKYEAHRTVLEVRELVEVEKEPGITEITYPSQRVAMLIYDSTLMLSALHKGDVIMAVEDAVFTADPGLEIKSGFAGKFRPLFLTLDEAGNQYLAVETDKGEALWVLDGTGKRLWEFPFSDAWGPLRKKPVIGFDRGVLLIFGRHLVSVSPQGVKRWTHEYAAGIGGASLTPDGFALTATGAEILALEPDGKRNVLIRLRGEAFGSAPVFTLAGEILVAGEMGLHKLAEKREP